MTARPGVQLLAEAAALIDGDRGDDYGPPLENFAHIVGIFGAITGIYLTPAEGILFMKAVKLARLARSLDSPAGWHRDSLVDDAGYTACLADVLTDAG